MPVCRGLDKTRANEQNIAKAGCSNLSKSAACLNLRRPARDLAACVDLAACLDLAACVDRWRPARIVGGCLDLREVQLVEDGQFPQFDDVVDLQIFERADH